MLVAEKIQEQKALAVDYGLVSIVMPNYNSEKYVEATVRSVLAQTYQNWELLFVDDCSDDNSLKIVSEYDDDRIKILKNRKNSGAAVSRNYALREAKGKWIAFLDSDDLWLPDKLEKQLLFMTSNRYRFSFTSYLHIDENSNSLHKKVVGPKRVNKRKMFRYDYLGCLTVMYDAEYVGLVQVDERLYSRNDYAMWLKVCQKCDCYFLNEPLAEYRIHGNSLSHSGLKRSIINQYKLFRLGEKMNPLRACFHVSVNMFWGVLKKVFFVKKTNR